MKLFFSFSLELVAKSFLGPTAYRSSYSSKYFSVTVIWLFQAPAISYSLLAHRILVRPVVRFSPHALFATAFPLPTYINIG